MGFLLFGLLPMGMSMVLTFLKWDFLRPPKWVGAANYVEIFSGSSSKVFWISFQNTMLFTFFGTLLSLSVALAVAAFLAKDVFGGHLFRAILFMPSLIIGTAFAMMMAPIFGNGDYGLINQVAHLLGLPGQKWLSTPGQGVWVLIVMSLWGIGGGMVIFLAGIKGIDKSYYEAAMIDGANEWQQFLKVTIPLISPVILFQTIMGMIGGMQVFDIAMALVNSSGISVNAGMGYQNNLATLVFYLYTKAFRDFNMGEAAVIAWFIFILSLVLSLIIFKISRQSALLGESEGGR